MCYEKCLSGDVIHFPTSVLRDVSVLDAPSLGIAEQAGENLVDYDLFFRSHVFRSCLFMIRGPVIRWLGPRDYKSSVYGFP